jgi:hypothetical protein
MCFSGRGALSTQNMKWIEKDEALSLGIAHRIHCSGLGDAGVRLERIPIQRADLLERCALLFFQ